MGYDPLWYFRPFDHRTHEDDRLPWRFVMPGVAISGDVDDTTVEWDRERQKWHVVQTVPGSDPALTYEVWADDMVCAVLALIAKRAANCNATFEGASDD